ncbi:MerR family transcriptional regulator [Mucilaginibacter robiniae]|uniref:MerR family transcriptional regulator n=1 Tax=Mucilaginibacter robiniae TaxID=2728022 RepID=A0A7L5DXA3_9SPHI|nr:chaperone modulator CbpM [Mucilaginibacter robiniae]QJD95381.1 MerR family transcriptional regulator [Mucilaginibacter robiniae]
MNHEHLTAADEFCSYHHIEATFIRSLEDAGLVQITVVNQSRFIPESQLAQLERMVRLHRELDINLAGIEAITHLLQRVEAMQLEMQGLRNRLRIYE